MLLRATVSLIVALTGLNIIGAAATALVAIYVVPEPQALASSHVIRTEVFVSIGYGVFALVVGVLVGIRKLKSLGDWLPSEQAPTPQQQLDVLRGPRTLARGIGALWFVGTVVVRRSDHEQDRSTAGCGSWQSSG